MDLTLYVDTLRRAPAVATEAEGDAARTAGKTHTDRQRFTGWLR